jgi:hypothetical protein
VRFQLVVDPTSEHGGFHGSDPFLLSMGRPLPNRRSSRFDDALILNRAVELSGAGADRFLVKVESDIVCSVACFLPMVSESATRSLISAFWPSGGTFYLSFLACTYSFKQ